MIREEELEVTYLDEVYVRLQCGSRSVVLRPLNEPLLFKNDGKHVVLRNGDAVMLRFDAPDSTCAATLGAIGYYLPYGINSAAFRKTILEQATHYESR